MIEEDLLKYFKESNDRKFNFFDNPISRFYIKLFLEKNYKLKKIIFLNKKHFLPKMLINRYEFTKQNHWPLVF